jgi:hypothetical protein
MDDESEKLFTASLQDLKNDVKSLDSKFDSMHEVLIRNSVILTEHERRSTASEQRLTVVEDKLITSAKHFERVKGFFLISGAILAALGSIGGLIRLVMLLR